MHKVCTWLFMNNHFLKKTLKLGSTDLYYLQFTIILKNLVQALSIRTSPS